MTEKPGYIRPKDAATLIIIDHHQGIPHVLMGRRHHRHAFMPGQYVFPGGRVDPTDSRVKIGRGYTPAVEAQLSRGPLAPASAARRRAFAIAAIRETYEEAGVFVARKALLEPDAPAQSPGRGFEAFAQKGLELDLEPFRFIARATTPPGNVRRFDTRFLATFADEIAATLPEGTGPSGELEDLKWLKITAAMESDDVPNITRHILRILQDRLLQDPNLNADVEVPFCASRSSR
ncbi:MAG: NUDIX domain-containing protein [Rhodobacteraceae bacterium]|nr:NUDIX domain-containing protein [Paracoccaceae bacterium]